MICVLGGGWGSLGDSLILTFPSAAPEGSFSAWKFLWGAGKFSLALILSLSPVEDTWGGKKGELQLAPQDSF